MGPNGPSALADLSDKVKSKLHEQPRYDVFYTLCDILWIYIYIYIWYIVYSMLRFITYILGRDTLAALCDRMCARELVSTQKSEEGQPFSIQIVNCHCVNSFLTFTQRSGPESNQSGCTSPIRIRCHWNARSSPLQNLKCSTEIESLRWVWTGEQGLCT
jgi:hypothetical protein